MNHKQKFLASRAAVLHISQSRFQTGRSNLVAEKSYFIGVDWGGASMRVGVVGKKGKVVAVEKRKTQPRGAHLIRGNAKATSERLAEAIERAVKDAGLEMRDIGGVGVAIPGAVAGVICINFCTKQTKN